MSVVEEKIRHKLQSHLSLDLLEIVNESPQHQVPENSETHFRLLIVSKDFQNLNGVQRHRKVYQILAEELKGPVHALSQRSFTPEEWAEHTTPSPSSPPCQKKTK